MTTGCLCLFLRLIQPGSSAMLISWLQRWASRLIPGKTLLLVAVSGTPARGWRLGFRHCTRGLRRQVKARAYRAGRAVHPPGKDLSSRTRPGIRRSVERGGKSPRIRPTGRRGAQERGPVLGFRPGPALRPLRRRAKITCPIRGYNDLTTPMAFEREVRSMGTRHESLPVHVCECTACRQHPWSRTAAEHRAINRIVAAVDERSRRLVAGFLAQQYGRGGIALLARITGLIPTPSAVAGASWTRRTASRRAGCGGREAAASAWRSRPRNRDGPGGVAGGRDRRRSRLRHEVDAPLAPHSPTGPATPRVQTGSPHHRPADAPPDFSLRTNRKTRRGPATRSGIGSSAT